MRKLAWGNVGVSEPGRVGGVWSGYVRQVRHLLPAVLIMGLLALAGLYVLNFVRADPSASLLEAIRLRLMDQSSLLSATVGHLRGWMFSVRFGINGALPFGPFVTILKLAVCAVAAAVFLRGPRGA